MKKGNRIHFEILFSFLLFFTEVGFGQEKSLECKVAPSSKSTSCSLKKEAPHSATLSDAGAIKKECEKQWVSLEFAKAATALGVAHSQIPTEDSLKERIVYFKESLKKQNAALEKLQLFLENFDEAKKKLESEKQAHIIDYEKMMSDYKIESDPQKKQKISSDYNKKYFTGFNYYVPSSEQELALRIETNKLNIKDLEARIAGTETQLAELIEAKAKGSSEEEKLIDVVTHSLAQNNQFLKENSKFKDCGLTTEELAAINWYSGSMYLAINQALRSNDPAKLKKYQPVINAINSGLEKLKPVTEIVKRLANLPPEVESKHCMGCVVAYEAFTSTSSGKGFNGQNMFAIKSKSGRYIAPLSQHKEEEEVLFKSGAKFKVLNVEKTHEGATLYTMEEVE